MTKTFLISMVISLTIFFAYRTIICEGATTAAPFDPRCPYPSDDITFFPDPTNCSRYYECYEGDLFIMDCFEGLYWNEDTLACDYPENVTCRLATTTTETPTPLTDETLSSTESTPPASTEEPTTETTVTTEEPTTTEPVTTTLSPATTEEPTTETTVTTEEPTTTEPVTTTLSPDVACKTAPDGTYLSNPHDCSRYFECVQGNAIPGQCPTGSLWNEIILNCDFSENVECHTDN